MDFRNAKRFRFSILVDAIHYDDLLALLSAKNHDALPDWVREIAGTPERCQFNYEERLSCIFAIVQPEIVKIPANHWFIRRPECGGAYSYFTVRDEVFRASYQVLDGSD